MTIYEQLTQLGRETKKRGHDLLWNISHNDCFFVTVRDYSGHFYHHSDFAEAKIHVLLEIGKVKETLGESNSRLRSELLDLQVESIKRTRLLSELESTILELKNAKKM